MLKAPCKQCEERTIGCHKRCKRYQEYKQTRQLINDSRYVANEADYEWHKATNRYKRG